jgi:dTDP-4-amino-4,6-dideoxygalactose transaminase
MNKKEAKKKIFDIIEENFDQIYCSNNYPIQYAGPVFDEKEICSIIDVLLDGWFGVGKKGTEFESMLAEYIGQKDGVVVNSGSSANLLALGVLKSNHAENPLQDGDELMSALCGFPTSMNTIMQNNLVPVFVDIELGNYNLDVQKIEEAITEKTKAIFVVHTLGNPADMKAIGDLAKKYKLYVIEDCADALGAKVYNQKVGSFGELSTFSFYAAHHITMGEGGAVLSSNEQLLRGVRSLRDWGRDCYCSGKVSLSQKGACSKRFAKWLPGIDEVFDHKYVYSEIGYNLKPLELQCAMGIQQMLKLDDFVKIRNTTFDKYFQFFKQYEEFFILPTWLEDAQPSWFVFPLTIRGTAPFKRHEISSYLESKKIQNRPLFVGNLLDHPAYKDIKYRGVGPFTNSNIVARDSFFVGLYPGIKDKEFLYIIEAFTDFLSKYK